VIESRIEKLLHPFLEKQTFAETLISRSFLNEQTKRGYLLEYQTRRNYLNA
jgi:serine/threonine-protein kinase HipA